MNRSRVVSFCLSLLGTACSGSTSPTSSDGEADAGVDAPPTSPPISFVAVTFNTGTTPGLAHDADTTDGYGSEQADISDQHYGDGLAWVPAMDAVTSFFAEVDPDVVVFQEMFFSGLCPTLPPEALPGFVCESWAPGDATVAQVVLGDGWQVACHLGKDDKCAAVKRSFGKFQGCDDDFCLEGLDGGGVEGCGSGSRVGRGVIELVGGGTVTVVNVHGTSGILPDDQSCRVGQFEQVFVDLGDGAPGANGERNVVLGDLNTDPGRNFDFDISAARFNDFVGPDKPFRFVSEVGPEAPASYAGLFNIDHVASDAFGGSCWTAGLTDGHATVFEPVYFDHKPVVCTLTEQ